MGTEKIIESTTGYSCPNCDMVASDKFTEKEGSFQSQTETVFVEVPDPHYAWVETHKCLRCGTVYTLNNGT